MSCYFNKDRFCWSTSCATGLVYMLSYTTICRLQCGEWTALITLCRVYTLTTHSTLILNLWAYYSVQGKCSIIIILLLKLIENSAWSLLQNAVRNFPTIILLFIELLQLAQTCPHTPEVTPSLSASHAFSCNAGPALLHVAPSSVYRVHTNTL